MQTKTVSVAVLAALVLSACASRPADVSPSYVSTGRYEDWDCKKLDREYEDVSQNLIEASGRLDSKANRDAGVTAVGVILFWPALFALGNNGQLEGDVARLKGEQSAIRTAMRRNNCGEPRFVPPVTPAPVQQSANDAK